MSNPLGSDFEPSTAVAKAQDVKRDFALAATLWRGVMYLGYAWMLVLLAMGVLTLAHLLPPLSEKGEGPRSDPMVWVATLAAYALQLGPAAVFTLAAWTFHLLAKDRSEAP